MARRKFRRAGLNTKIILDTVLAGVGVRVLPMVLNKFVPIDQTVSSLVGAGGVYVAGSLMKKPDMANIGVGMGVVEFVTPIIEDLVGGLGMSPAPVSPVVKGVSLPVPITKQVSGNVPVADFIHLNEYTNDPSRKMNVGMYSSSY